jgi:hypothetical protein
MILEDDLEIKIQFANGRDIYGNYSDFVGAGQNFPRFNAEVILEKFSFVMPTSSIASQVKANGRNEYAFMYPNLVKQSRIGPNAVIIAGDNKNEITATISGWRQGTTTSLLLALVPDRVYGSTVVTDPANIGLPQHNLYVAIENIEVIMDGQSIVQMKDDEASIRSLLRGPEDEFPLTTLDDGVVSRYTTIRLSQFAKKSVLGENSQEAGVDLVSKTVQFKMTTPRSLIGIPLPSSYTLIAIQNINASLETAQMQNKIRFV